MQSWGENQSSDMDTCDTSRNYIASAAFWNTIAGLLFAAQNIVILIVIAYACGAEAAGIYTIAYTVGNLFLYIGNYGMRQFEASDCNDQFTFPVYRKSRQITCLIMIVSFLLYVAVCAILNDYSLQKTVIILLVCSLKVIDAYEDVYHGEYQREGRLDVAARCLSLRMVTTIALVCAAIALSVSMEWPLFIALLYSIVFLSVEIRYVNRRYGMPVFSGRKSLQVLVLLKKCLPLCVAAFLAFYVGNAPRYAIDATMNDVANAYFGYIMMPNFVIALLMSFIFNPMITPLADMVVRGRMKEFAKRIGLLIIAVVILTMVIALLTWLIGTQLLGMLFNADLQLFKSDLMILIIGGGFVALVTLFTMALTIIRAQNYLIPVYILVVMFALPGSALAVSGWGIWGASVVYTAIMVLLAALLAICFMYKIKRLIRLS